MGKPNHVVGADRDEMDDIKEIAILSGKGGTGKTSLTASFGDILGRVVLADCDVDAPDLHILLKPHVIERHSFQAGKLATIDDKRCSLCNLCVEECRFEAISISDRDGVPVIDPFLCEGCGVCKLVCPSEAISMEEKEAGEWMISETRTGPMVHATLLPGAENSGKLVSIVKENAKRIAQEKGIKWILVDGPPGIGCPVISSMAGIWRTIVVTEPTLSGKHDMIRILKLAKHFNVSGFVVVNKWDLNPEISLEIQKVARDMGAHCVGNIPYSEVFVSAQLNGRSVVEIDPYIRESIKDIWNNVINN